MARWLDATMPVAESMTTWPGRPPPQRVWDRRIADGGKFKISSCFPSVVNIRFS